MSLIPRPTFVVGRVATQTASIGGKIVQYYSKMSYELRQNHYCQSVKMSLICHKFELFYAK